MPWKKLVLSSGYYSSPSVTFTLSLSVTWHSRCWLNQYLSLFKISNRANITAVLPTNNKHSNKTAQLYSSVIIRLRKQTTWAYLNWLNPTRSWLLGDHWPSCEVVNLHQHQWFQWTRRNPSNSFREDSISICQWLALI